MTSLKLHQEKEEEMIAAINFLILFISFATNGHLKVIFQFIDKESKNRWISIDLNLKNFK